MRITAVIGALLAALIALLSGLAFWGAACAMIVVPVLERSPIRFLPKEGMLGYFFVIATIVAGAILLAGAHEIVGWVMDMAFKAPASLERPAQPALQVLEGGKPAPPSA